MRRAARVDANQAEIVAALRAAGATVQPLHQVGQGCPDLLVGYRGVNYLIECKGMSGRFTYFEYAWIRTWAGRDVCVAYSVDEALRAIGAM